MKPKYAFINFLVVILVIAASISSPLSAAEEPKDVGADLPTVSNPFKNPKLSVRIPTLPSFRDIVCETTAEAETCYVPWLADYIEALYRYGVGIIGILAVITIMIGGVMWVTAGGNESKITEARKWISGSLMGIVIALTSYMLLNLINPALTELSPIKIATVLEEDLPEITEYQEIIQNGGSLPTNLKTAPTNIVTVEVETKQARRSVQVDATIAELTKKTLKEVKDAGFDVWEIGGYRASKFCHGRGLALDMNVRANYCIDCYGEKNARVGEYYRPQGPGAGSDYTADPTSFPGEIVAIFKRNGWCWGGDWGNIKDYMHFSTPTCRNGAECGEKGLYNFSKSVKQNHADSGITYP